MVLKCYTFVEINYLKVKNEKINSKIPYCELLDNDFELINKLSELKEK